MGIDIGCVKDGVSRCKECEFSKEGDVRCYCPGEGRYFVPKKPSVARSTANRVNLEWLVYLALTSPDPIISISRGRELLGFTYMEEMREWMRNYNGEESVQE